MLFRVVFDPLGVMTCATLVGVSVVIFLSFSGCGLSSAARFVSGCPGLNFWPSEGLSYS